MLEQPTVAVIGLGYVGSCLAVTLAGRGVPVVGVDIDEHLVAEFTTGVTRLHEAGLGDALRAGLAAGTLRAGTDYAAVRDADVVLIAVSTPVRDDGSLADTALRSACLTLGEELRPGQLVVLKSTVPPGTTRNLVLPLLERGGLTAGHDFALAFSPERLAEGTALADLRTLPIVVGGLDTASTRRAADFWHQTLSVDVLPQQSPEAAEIVKLADNWWIDLNIALANELAKFSALFDVDVLDVIEAANTIPKGNGMVNILRPSVGVGGSCLTKDPWMVWRSGLDHGLDIRTAKVGREVNAGMPAHTARLILDAVKTEGHDLSATVVGVLGLAFKNNTGDLRATPVAEVVDELLAAGVQVRVHDPLVDVADAEQLLGMPLTATVEDAVRGAACVAVLAWHEQFRRIDFASLPVADRCAIVDGRAYFSKEKIAMFRQLGYTYLGIGR